MVEEKRRYPKVKRELLPRTVEVSDLEAVIFSLAQEADQNAGSVLQVSRDEASGKRAAVEKLVVDLNSRVLGLNLEIPSRRTE